MKASVSTFLFAVALFFLASLESSFAQVATDEKEVVVLGIGTTEDEAKQQAYRSAIQSVIGSMVLSETIVKNESLVQDKILSHSNGYVVKAAQVGKTRHVGSNLLEVTMRVTVKSQQLQKRLQAENISMADVDGQSLFAQKKTQDEAKQDAASIITEKLKNIPSSVLMATAFPQNAKQESKGSMVRLNLPVEVTVDKAAYNTFFDDFTQTLHTLGFKSVSKTLNGEHRGLRYDKNSFYRIMRKSKNHTPLYVLAMADTVFRETKTARWKLCEVSEEIFQTLLNSVRKFELKVELLDKNSQIIAEVTTNYTERGANSIWEMKGGTRKDNTVSGYYFNVSGAPRHDPAAGVFYILPEVIVEPHFQGVTIPLSTDTLTTTIPFDLTEKELADIASVKCTISNIPVPQQ